VTGLGRFRWRVLPGPSGPEEGAMEWVIVFGVVVGVGLVCFGCAGLLCRSNNGRVS